MKKIDISFGLAIVLILAAAATRFLPHPPNFTALGSLALFGGAYFSRKNLSWLIPFTTLFISDIILNNRVYHIDFTWYSLGTYLAFGLVFLMGKLISSKISVQRILLGSAAASLVFFLVTNLFSWQYYPFYTKDMVGLIQCFVAALPFFWNTIAGDLCFSFLMFGLYYISVKQFKLTEQHAF
jgi:hypothetical protein